jgi:glycosyltransferase involved in cell wall biosynthesis
MLKLGLLPKISCLMVTAPNRLEYLKRSFRCFCDQTYPNRELVIINDGPAEYQDAIANVVGDRSNVRLLFLKEMGYTLGALRNIGVALCKGDIYVQWDDDDFNAPERLMVQCSRLLKCSARMCFLSDQLHFYFPTKQLFWDNWKLHSGGWKKFGLIPGTIMAWVKDFPYRYPSAGEFAGAGEDSVMTHKICDEHSRDVKLLEGIGYHHVYSFHGKNVWDIEHHLEISKVRGLKREALLNHREHITRTLDYMQLADEIQVVGKDGLAFIWRPS